MNCGAVVEEKLVDLGPEWRAFDSEEKEKRSRVGSPVSLITHDKGLFTTIDGKTVNKSARERAALYRLIKWQRRIRISSSMERNLSIALSFGRTLVGRLGLPKDILETASIIYRYVISKKYVRGKSIESMMAAAIYAACRRSKIPRTIDEIASASSLEKKDVARCYRYIITNVRVKVPVSNSKHYIPRLIEALKMNGDVEVLSNKIISSASKNGLTGGRGPAGIAAAAVYIASIILGDKRTQRDIADVAKVTEVTIRNRYKEFMRDLIIEVKV